jgi:hypothetical protein
MLLVVEASTILLYGVIGQFRTAARRARRVLDLRVPDENDAGTVSLARRAAHSGATCEHFPPTPSRTISPVEESRRYDLFSITDTPLTRRAVRGRGE